MCGDVHESADVHTVVNMWQCVNKIGVRGGTGIEPWNPDDRLTGLVSVDVGETRAVDYGM